jgi:hypothetical protein
MTDVSAAQSNWLVSRRGLCYGAAVPGRRMQCTHKCHPRTGKNTPCAGRFRRPHAQGRRAGVSLWHQHRAAMTCTLSLAWSEM